MQRTVLPIITFFCITLFIGCNSVKKQSWEQLIPGETTFVITPKPGVQLANIGATNYASILDDWLEKDSYKILGRKFESLDFI